MSLQCLEIKRVAFDEHRHWTRLWILGLEVERVGDA